jgi:hypothetical protein
MELEKLCLERFLEAEREWLESRFVRGGGL